MEVFFTLDKIGEAAQQFLKSTSGYRVFALHGEMGAGKTTFVHAVCEAMGVSDLVTSPTFSIINQYLSKTGEAVYHIDLYRLKDDAEAINSGVEDCLYSGNTCFVEWPDQAGGIFPEDTVHLYLTAIDTNTRKLKINL